MRTVTTGHGAPEIGCDLLFLRGVDRRERVVEHEERRRAGESPRQGYTLALSAGERQAPLATTESKPAGNRSISSAMPATSAAWR
jgi:hypothetical protein